MATKYFTTFPTRSQQVFKQIISPIFFSLKNKSLLGWDLALSLCKGERKGREGGAGPALVLALAGPILAEQKKAINQSEVGTRKSIV